MVIPIVGGSYWLLLAMLNSSHGCLWGLLEEVVTGSCQMWYLVVVARGGCYGHCRCLEVVAVVIAGVCLCW